MKIRTIVLASSLFLPSLGSAAEKHPVNPPSLGIPRDVHRAASAMDRIARQVEEWGTMHMSAALLVKPDTNFAFNLQRGASNYFAEAKAEVQGAAAFSDQAVQSFNAAVRLQEDPVARAAFGDVLQRYRADTALYQDNRGLLQALGQLEFTEGLNLALAETNPATRLALLATLRTNLLAGLPTNSYPTLGSNNVPNFSEILRSNTNVTGVFSSSSFTGFLGLLDRAGGPDPTLKNRIALNIAAGDQVTESIFRLLGEPDKARHFDGKDVFFSIATVSVNPGYRTQKNYAADLGVAVSLTWVEARPEVIRRMALDKSLSPRVRAAIQAQYNVELPAGELGVDVQQALNNVVNRQTALAEVQGLIPSYVHAPGESDFSPVPLAMAVSPLADLDVIDAASSMRRQNEFSFSLAGVLRKAGMMAEASAVEQYARRREMDARTRTAQANINTYSIGGGMFGWQVGPQFRAVGNPGNYKKGGPANILERQTFPALILIGLQKDEMRPKFRIAGCKVMVVEPYLEFQTIAHWKPLKSSMQTRFSEEERLESSARLVAARQAIARLENGFSRTSELARSRLKNLIYQLNGSITGQPFDPEYLVPLPAGPKPFALPANVQIVPGVIELDIDGQGDPLPRRQKFVIVGSNLNSVDLANIIPFMGNVRIVQRGKVNDSLIIEADVTSANPIVFNLPVTLKHPSGETAVINLPSPRVDVVRRRALEVAAPNTRPIPIVKTVQTPPIAPGGSNVFSVEIAPAATFDQLEAARIIIENELNKNKALPPAGNVNVDVQAIDRN